MRAKRLYETQLAVHELDEQLERSRDQVGALALEGNEIKVSLGISEQARVTAEAESMAQKKQIGTLQSLLKQAQVGSSLLCICCVTMHLTPGVSARSASAVCQMAVP